VFEDDPLRVEDEEVVGPRDDAHVNRAALGEILGLDGEPQLAGQLPVLPGCLHVLPEPLCDLGRGERLVVLEAVGRHYVHRSR